MKTGTKTEMVTGMKTEMVMGMVMGMRMRTGMVTGMKTEMVTRTAMVPELDRCHYRLKIQGQDPCNQRRTGPAIGRRQAP